MPSLANQLLTPCTDSVALSSSLIEEYLLQLNDWQLEPQNTPSNIKRSYGFKNFILAMNFAQAICLLAEQENHHPKICIEWGKVSISWWTHSLNGLCINDFIMAARCDHAYSL